MIQWLCTESPCDNASAVHHHHRHEVRGPELNKKPPEEKGALNQAPGYTIESTGAILS